MKVCVQGLSHLGTVTAACLADRGHRVVGVDDDGTRVSRLALGVPPVSEPGLEDLVRRNLANGRLEFSTDPSAAAGAEVVWVAQDTPVDAEDRADVAWVVTQVERLFPHLGPAAVVLVSAQVPVGTTALLETALRAARPGHAAQFAYSPENLRLGEAIRAFTEPARVVVGVRTEGARSRITELLAPITERIEWMSVESAEMTKHALNAFLAVSVTFANEIAGICERVGADAKEVERGLKSEARIGPGAYLSPGAAFAGGTLARDVEFLSGLARQHALELPLIAAVRPSNEAHKHWAQGCLERRLGRIEGATIAVWGLTYKPGTDSLRRSMGVELCQQLFARGAKVRAYDPAVRALPPELAGSVELQASAKEAVRGASALIVATQWPEFRSAPLKDLIGTMSHPIVIDANRFLVDAVEGLDLEYFAVGTASMTGEGHGRA